MAKRAACHGLALLVFLMPVWACERSDESPEARFGLRDLEPEEAEFLIIINEYRATHGLGTLTATRTLNQAAYDHSLDMATQDYFDHTSLDGRSPWDRMCEAGHEPACSISAAMAENIAAGNASSSATFEQWRTSPGHNANMLDGRFTAIGIGRAYGASSSYGYYWTTDFSSVVDDVSCLCSTGDTRPCSSECGAGLQHCDDGCNWGHCDAPQPSDEVCDGLDNDCDGSVDEDEVCGPDCIPEPEVCDGADNDCDTLIDEDGVCGPDCVPEPEVCDGADNDCDTLVDEDNVCGQECVPSDEICDGIDNDCDTLVDEDGVCGPDCVPEPETCDGVDNDCNGLIDDSPLCSAGLSLVMEGGCGCEIVL